MVPKWTGSEPEVGWKWTGSGSEVDWKFIFLVNYNCDASYEHLWCPNGPEVNRKWTGSDRKWARSGLEVSICPSVRLSIPNTSLTSLTNLMRGIYKHRALAPCDFLNFSTLLLNAESCSALMSIWRITEQVLLIRSTSEKLLNNAGDYWVL